MRDSLGRIDWKLLVFLLLFLNVKMVIKLIAIIIIYILQPDLRFGFRFKNSRLPLFYIIVIVISVFNLIIPQLFTNLHYDLVFITGISFWTLSILAIHQIKLSVDKNDTETIHQTLLYFFLINIIISLIMYAGIIWETGTINPFQYQGEFEKYFMSTGDYIKGVTVDTSTTNAIINAFGVFYFLQRKNVICCLLCMIVLLLTGSNIINIIFCLVLIYVFIFQSTKDQKSVLIVCAMFLVIFLAKISPQNKNYLAENYTKYFEHSNPTIQSEKSTDKLIQKNAVLTEDDIKQKIAREILDSINNINSQKTHYKIIGNIKPSLVSQITAKPEIPVPNNNFLIFQYKDDTTATQRKLLQYIAINKSTLPLSGKENSVAVKYPGKIIAFKQTENYFCQNPSKIITGAGIGNFSSKLAFRSTALNIAGGYPEKYSYLNNDFKINHWDLYLYYFSKHDRIHSLVNSPFSIYDQLLTEYGLLGLLSFFIFYISFFARNLKYLTYGIPVLLIMMGAFFIDYWFEQLSVVIVFELLLLLNIKETTPKH